MVTDSTQRYPPNHEAIVSEKESFRRFRHNLFYHENHLDISIKNFLTATILRWLPNFIDLVFEDPQSRWVKKNHPLLEFMYEICHDINIDQELLHTWHKEIYTDFVKYNFHSIKLKDLGSLTEHAVTDSRSVLEVINHIATTTSELNENYWMNVRSAQVVSSVNKKLIAKVENVEKELQEVKEKKLTNAVYDERVNILHKT